MSQVTAQINIAIDGFSSCGKSTLACDLARRLGYMYIDSGAMYRAATLYFIRNSIDISDIQAVKDAMEHVHIHFRHIGDQHFTILNDEVVESDIRSMDVNALVSQVAAISEVRTILVAQQQQLGLHKGVVMDGRDIGTVVFPDAALKFFLKADIDVRIQRRYDELRDRGLDITMEQVRESIGQRDKIDSTRADSPLRQAADAIVIDNTRLSRQEQLEIAYELTMEKIRNTSRRS